ncbi:MAG: sigma-54-dependent Fis family transcriptional regulator [Desulfarculus sp.]|nr:sigma-54-dependent Fis family transcriptional regulator [Desulfarculus sp.]
MIQYNVFVVDDEESIRDAAQLTLTQYNVRTFASAEEAVAAIEEAPPDLVLMDIGLPGMSGVEALKRVKAKHPEVLFIMITAYEDVDTVVAAMKHGAYDYVVKPLHMDKLRANIANALQTIRLRKEVRALQERYLRENLPCFIGESNTIQDVLEFVAMVAKSPDAPVLIVGETGTGKELIASAIHFQSPNFAGPLVTLNCAALPGELLESELFGYEGGAFSGAKAHGKAGLIEQAAGGTLFLDEVGDLSPEAQAKLLRFLDAGEYYKVGGTKKLNTRTRVVSATNRDLEGMIEQGRFRSDLYYRLAVLKIVVPSLNKRRADILPLARHFLLEFGKKYGKEFTDLSPEAQDFLLQRPWPGNVRELKSIMERGVLSSKGPELEVASLGLAGQAGGGAMGAGPGGRGGLPPLSLQGLDLTLLLEEVERDYLEQALALAEGSDVKAAELLNLNYHTLRYRKKKLGIA